jgi:hypothetical protein
MVGWQFCVKTVKNFQVSLKKGTFRRADQLSTFQKKPCAISYYNLRNFVKPELNYTRVAQLPVFSWSV